MKLLIVVLLTAAVVNAQTTCPALPPSNPDDPHQLALTSDFMYLLYIDGELIDNPPNYDNVDLADNINLPQYARLIAMQGQAFGAHGGILGSIQPNDYFVTSDIDWRCRNAPQNGWETLGFDDSTWPVAVSLGSHGNYPGVDYGCISGISPDAYWIWTANNGAPNPLDRNVYCRGYIPLCTKNNPCQNGGTCSPNSAGSICTCPPDYAGSRCEIDLNACRSSPCQNGGTCTNNISEGSYMCDCTANYTGSNCETMLDACQSSPCLNNGTCINGGSFFVCSCPAFYSGNRCESQIAYHCGQILHNADNASLPNNWHLGCYIGVGDEVFWNTPCFALLQGLSYYGSSDRLISAGGNYGCWMTNNPSSSDIYNACADNYQQNIFIRQCASCNFLAVCVRFPLNSFEQQQQQPSRGARSRGARSLLLPRN